MRITQKISFLLLVTASFLMACAGKPTNSEQKSKNAVTNPVFNGDSAFLFVQRQVDFGPRVPGTSEHLACANFLDSTLRQFGAEVTVQHGEATIYNGLTKPLINIIASYNPQAPKRLLLCAHWDTRPYADQDKNPANQQKPILGANDGASGVAVLLEVARQLHQHEPAIGVDIVLFDLEDWGAPEFYTGPQRENTWCLGSQYWAQQASKNGYKADFGILIDMVGAPNAQFYKEQISTYYASFAVDKVWDTAHALGFRSYFINQVGGAITDDHLYVNRIAHIPCINIIQYNPYSATGFGDYWHTQDDTMKHIDKKTLYVVGQTLLHIIYNL
ncbi:MAG TPA: M28 family peptidase [Paludibacteraceae bacterium]|nr:M28 family peptidase [Paludibacteraceae bacterium]HQB68840.1 M28 family peptidase [Paludibacteraceae bacterium]HRS67503.1 M28 family peptidase [Paludibacteraceae bacterium]